MRYLTTLFFIIIFGLCGYAFCVNAELSITEVLANPNTASDKSEWVELFNNSGAEVQLSSYTLDNSTLPSYSLPAYAYVVVTKSLVDFNAEFSSLIPAIQLSNISLSNSGDTVILKKSTVTVDSITIEASPTFGSWSRTGPLCNKWDWFVTHTAGQQNTNYKPECVDATLGQIEWQCKNNLGEWVTSFNLPAKVNLECKLQNYSGNADFFINNNLVTFPNSVSQLTNLEAKVKVANADYKISTNNFTVYSNLVIDSFMPNPVGADSGAEWVKLYNPNDYEVNLSGYSIYDSQDKLLDLTGQIPAKSFTQVLLPGLPLNNCTSTTCTEQVALKYLTTQLDLAAYSKTEEGKPWQKIDSNWWIVDLQNIQKLLLTEVGEYWLEFYNPADYPINTSNITVFINGATQTMPAQFVMPKSYFVWQANSAISGQRLEIADGISALLTIPQLSNNKSYGLEYAESEYLPSWVDSVPTPAASNVALATVPSTSSKSVAKATSQNIAATQNVVVEPIDVKPASLNIVTTPPRDLIKIVTWYIPVWQIGVIISAILFIAGLYFSGLLTKYLYWRLGLTLAPTVPNLRLDPN